MAITVRTRREAWDLVNKLFPTDYAKDDKASENAGYPIFWSTEEGRNAWISDLNDRLEINIGSDTTNIWIENDDNATTRALLKYLRSQMADFKKAEARYGIADREVEHKLDAMIACKEMAESIIGQPVNLKLDGTVTIGF